eukprot:7118792-Ditylum_brightwellii.AAC.1
MCQEEIPEDMPESYGKPVMTTILSMLIFCITSSREGSRQNTAQTETFESECVAAKTAMDQIV